MGLVNSKESLICRIILFRFFRCCCCCSSILYNHILTESSVSNNKNARRKLNTIDQKYDIRSSTSLIYKQLFFRGGIKINSKWRQLTAFVKTAKKRQGDMGNKSAKKKRKYETVLMTFTPISFKVFFFCFVFFLDSQPSFRPVYPHSLPCYVGRSRRTNQAPPRLLLQGGMTAF